MMLFRLTPEEHERIRLFQLNNSTYRELLGKRLGTDHDHKTGLIRGLLEWRINRAYGLLEKVCEGRSLPKILRALAWYHEYPPAVAALREKRYGLIGQAKKKRRMIYGPPKGEA